MSLVNVTSSVMRSARACAPAAGGATTRAAATTAAGRRTFANASKCRREFIGASPSVPRDALSSIACYLRGVCYLLRSVEPLEARHDSLDVSPGNRRLLTAPQSELRKFVNHCLQFRVAIHSAGEIAAEHDLRRRRHLHQRGH